jgi:DNA-binding NtrC family response regulator
MNTALEHLTSTTQKTVVLVEDEPIIRMHELMLLQDLGFSALDFESAEAALRYLEDHSTEVLVLFTDIRMPGSVDGLMLAKIVGQRWPWIRVVLASGHAQAEELALPREMMFIRKPFSPAEVIDTMSEWPIAPEPESRSS